MYIPTSQLDSIQITSQFSFQTYKNAFRPMPHCFSLLKPAILEDNTQVEQFSSVQFSSVAQSCLTLCNPMDCSTSGLPVHYQLPEFTQTHVHWVGEAIQPSHPLPFPSPPTFTFPQHQGLFKWVTSLHQVAKVLEFHLQHRSLQWILSGTVEYWVEQFPWVEQLLLLNNIFFPFWSQILIIHFHMYSSSDEAN